MQNTKESRREIARIVGGAFGGDLKDIEHEIDPLPLAGSFTPDNKLASVCVFEINAAIKGPTWGQIRYLATDGDHQGGGHGLSAMRASLEFMRAHTDDKMVRLYADNYSKTYKSARLEPDRSAVSFYEMLGMKKSNDWSPILDENGAIAQQWMVGSIDVALQRINERLTKRDVIPRAHVIDPGAYNAIRCTPEGAFELRYTFTKYGWCDFAISDVKGLTADAEIDWTTVEPQIAAMGIARQNIEDAIAKRDKPVTLYAGARTRSGGVEGQERIAYPQASDGLEEDVMCMIKAAASGIHYCDYEDPAAAIMEGAINERITSKTLARRLMRR